MSDTAYDLAQHLVVDAALGSTNLPADLLTKNRETSDEPEAPARALRQRWPDLTEEDRRGGFIAAIDTLNAPSRECIESVARLGPLSGEAGRGERCDPTGLSPGMVTGPPSCMR